MRDECPLTSSGSAANYIYLDEVTEIVHAFLYLFKETGKNPDADAMRYYMDEAVDASPPEIKEITYKEEEDGETVFRLWDYNCPECERFLLMVDEVHALQFSTRHGAYHFLCGNCYRKMILNKQLES